MKYLSVFVLFCLCACAYSCKGKYGDFQKSESGLEYQIFANHAESAARPQVGDVLELEYSYEVENGRVLFDSKENGRGYLKKLEEATQQGGCLEDGLAMMCEGDSAVFRIMAENFLLFTEKYGRLPEGVNGTDNIIVQVRLLNIMDKEDMEKFVASTYHNNEEQEMEFLSNYLKNSNISVEPTNSGLYYVPQTEGKGDFIKSGDIVTLNYTLTLIDGALVETTLGDEPMRYVVGTDRVIDGWEEGIMLMKKGSVAQLIIPSNLAYGSEGKGDILPYSTLIFEVEIIDVQ